MHGPEITFFSIFYACFYEECGERNNKTSNSFLAFLSLSEHRLESWSREISSFCQYFWEFFPKTIRQGKKNTLKGCPSGFFRRGLKEWWRVKKSGVILMDGLYERGVSPDVLLMLWLLNQKRHIRMSDMILAFFSELYDNILSMFSMNDYIWEY